MELGISKENPKRIESAIKYSLILASHNGNSCVIYENSVHKRLIRNKWRANRRRNNKFKSIRGNLFRRKR